MSFNKSDERKPKINYRERILICSVSILLLFVGCAQQKDKRAKEQSEIEVVSGFAKVNGTRLYYEVAGSGELIVLIHGNGGDCRHWDGQFEDFAKSHKVLRYDVRGYGKSSLPVKGVRYSDHDDLKALLQYLGISKAHVAGFSMGCGFAVDFVLAYPEMSNSLIAIGPWAVGYNSSAVKDLMKDLGKVSSVLKEGETRAAAEAFINAPCFNPHMIKSDIKDRILEMGYDYSFWHWMNSDPRSYVSPPAARQLDRISVPTLIITAEYDIEACREIADLMEQEIPNTKKVDIADATHFMFMEKPAEVNKNVLDFLRKIKKVHDKKMREI